MFEIVKNSTLTNNKKEIDVTENGKNFPAPRVQSPSVQSSIIQVSRRPESKPPGVQILSVQSSRVQVSYSPESKRPNSKNAESKRPNHTSRVQLFWYAFLNLNAIYCTGFVVMFCNNVEISLSCLLMQLDN